MKPCSSRLAPLVAVVVVAFGCGSSAPRTASPPPPHQPTCQDAADKSTAVLMAQLGSEAGTNVAIRQAIVDAFAASCSADVWSPNAIACYGAATDATFDACGETLTEGQNQSLQTRLAQAVQDAAANSPETRSMAPAPGAEDDASSSGPADGLGADPDDGGE